jgi:hypothetical protein
MMTIPTIPELPSSCRADACSRSELQPELAQAFPLCGGWMLQLRSKRQRDVYVTQLPVEGAAFKRGSGGEVHLWLKKG